MEKFNIRILLNTCDNSFDPLMEYPVILTCQPYVLTAGMCDGRSEISIHAEIVFVLETF
jgi:hypothetical protein